MSDGPDPLGKRALYWMPVDPEAEGDATLDGPGGVTEPVVRHSPRHARPAGKHALFSDATPAAEPERDRAVATAADPLSARGFLTVACSRCGSVTRIGLVDFLVLHFPVGAWLPGRTFDRWMTCPACRHRTWTSVSLTR
jgi:hypothetical protein